MTPSNSTKPILLLQMQRMGDLILTFPLFLWLKRRFPKNPLFVVAEPVFYQDLIGISPEVHYISWKDSHLLTNKNFLFVLNLSNRPEAAELAGQVKCEEYFGPFIDKEGNRRVGGAWQLYRVALVENNRYNRFHWADMNALDVVPLAEIIGTHWGMPREYKKIRNVGLFLGASQADKKLTSKNWIKLFLELEKRDLRPILLGGPEDTSTAQEVVAALGKKVVNFCGCLSLNKLAAIGQELSLFITPDTGPMHLAAWTGTKVLNLSLGPVSAWETGPYQPGHYVLEPTISCRPCWSCRDRSLRCRNAFTPGRVATFASALVKDETSRLTRMQIPGLRLSKSSRTPDGLYDLQPVVSFDNKKTDADAGHFNCPDVLGNFWRNFFLGILLPQGTSDEHVSRKNNSKQAWKIFADSFPDLAFQLASSLPPLVGRLAISMRRGKGIGRDFWIKTPPSLRPLSSYLQTFLENEDFSRQAWSEVFEYLEILAACIEVAL